MKRITYFNWSLVSLLLVALFSGVISISVTAQASNLLIDPGFEGEQYNLVSIDPVDGTTFSVPNGWGGGVAREPHSETWMNIQPTGFPHTGPYRWSGSRSLHVARGFATFTAWIYQQVSVKPNTDVQGGAYAFLESGSTAVVRVGIDPNGGTNPFVPGVVWGDWQGGLYQWNHPTVSTRAGSSGAVTLFLFATQNSPNNPNGTYWDDAFLNGIPGSGAIPGGSSSQGQQFVIPTILVNVRAGAGTNFQRIGAAGPTESFPYQGEVGNWYEINYNGRTAYISKDFATVSGSPSAGASVPIVDALDFTASYTLRMRSAPGGSAPEVAIIQFKTVLRAIGRSADNAWLLVEFQGQTGWVAARYGRLSGNINSLAVR
ncbi:MAG TPA: SH3 domain-containing protein [Phototrophicaceae bacterium]|nr:SH3 domain-containing protein [Phototrophicaceae bacterium]